MEFIKNQLWSLKLHYFFHGFGGAPILPFLSVIARQLGMPGSGIGITIAIIQVTSLFLRPLIGGLMDSFPRHKISIFRLLMVGHLLGFYLVQFVPPIETHEKTLKAECIPENNNLLSLTVEGEIDPCLLGKFHAFYDRKFQCQFQCELRDDPQGTTFPGSFHGKLSTFAEGKSLRVHLDPDQCTSDITLCYANCSDPDMRHVLNRQHDTHKARSNLNYWLLTLLWVFGGITAGGVVTFQDAICHQVLDSTKSKEHYGHQRLFASLGWGIAAFLVGYLVDLSSAQSLLFNYNIAFTVMFVAWAMDIWIVGFLKIPQASGTRSQSQWAELSGSIFNVEVLVFLFYCVIVGICFSVLPFHFILLEELGNQGSCSSIQALKLLQGLCLTLNCMGEIPVFFHSGSLIRRFGARNIMNSVLFLFALRFLYYSRMTGPWDTIWVEFFNGWCVALFFPAMTTFASRVAEEGSATTMTALAFAAYEGIGGAMGGTVAGAMYEAFGASQTFEYFSMFALGGFFVYLFLQKWVLSAKPSSAFQKLHP